MTKLIERAARVVFERRRGEGLKEQFDWDDPVVNGLRQRLIADATALDEKRMLVDPDEIDELRVRVDAFDDEARWSKEWFEEFGDERSWDELDGRARILILSQREELSKLQAELARMRAEFDGMGR